MYKVKFCHCPYVILNKARLYAAFLSGRNIPFIANILRNSEFRIPNSEFTERIPICIP